MGFPVTINGNTYNESDFTGYGYKTALPSMINDTATALDGVDTAAATASAAASAASTAATNAAASYDAFDDRYLGSKTSDPTVDNDGNALLTGALYWKSTATTGMRVYNGSAWEAAGIPISSGLTTGDIGVTVQGYDADTAKIDVAQSWTASQTLSDYQLIRAMFKDQGYAVVDKGNINNATVTFDYSAGSVQTYTATGSTVTWATSNWPPTGNLGELLIIGTNMGAYTHSISGITWIKPDGTTTTSIATYLAAITGRTAFQTSGIDQILLWSRDAGTTIYGKLI